LQDVELEVQHGEVMALLGENGAGKSTLVKILAGLVDPDEGTITIAGEELDPGSPGRSLAAGIAVVQQELSLVATLSVAENVFLGGRSFAGPWTRGRLARRAGPYLERVGLQGLDPHRLVESLSVAERQLVEIARLLARDARVLILDEPTAALSDVEIERVKQVVRSLAGEGNAVIYVTHRLGEVFELANRVTVFRNGRSQPSVAVSRLSMDQLIERILGRPLEEMFPPRSGGLGEPVLVIEGVETQGLSGPIDLTVHAGEIVGLGGQLGSGAGRLLRAVAGADAMSGGSVRVHDDLLRGHALRRAIRAGIVYCSDDRKRDGIFPARSVTENLSSAALWRVTPRGVVSRRRENALARDLAGFFQIDTRRLGHRAATLSGGNQQKVALGKWLGAQPRVVLVEEPTRGVDVGARAEIYRHLRRLANDGLAVVFASSDLPEVLGLADTVASFYRGRLVRVAPAQEWTAARLLADVMHAPTMETAA
jgi:ribose transport system ATP-binding protein/rhamnose transport system ATP-binding protein